jgi:hypothetical protein
MFGQLAHGDTLNTEYVAESSIWLSQDGDLPFSSAVLQPVKKVVQDPQMSLTAYTLARILGAPSQLAFFCQFTSFTQGLSHDLSPLVHANTDFFETLARSKKKQVSEEVIEEVSTSELLTLQMSYLQRKQEQLRIDTYARFSSVGKFISAQYLLRSWMCEYGLTRHGLSEPMSLTQFLDAYSSSFAFVSVGLPILCGVSYAVQEQAHIIDVGSIDWLTLESLVKNISILSTIRTNPVIRLFLKELITSDKQAWFGSTYDTRLSLAQSDPQITEQLDTVISKLYTTSKSLFESLVLPESLKTKVGDILAWSGSLAGVIVEDVSDHSA